MATRVSEGLKPLNDATIQFVRATAQGGTVERVAPRARTTPLGIGFCTEPATQNRVIPQCTNILTLKSETGCEAHHVVYYCKDDRDQEEIAKHARAASSPKKSIRN